MEDSPYNPYNPAYQRSAPSPPRSRSASASPTRRAEEQPVRVR